MVNRLKYAYGILSNEDGTPVTRWSGYLVTHADHAAEVERLRDELQEALADKDRFFRQMRDNANDRDMSALRIAELEAAIDDLDDDIQERTKAGMLWGMYSHPTISPEAYHRLIATRSKEPGDRFAYWRSLPESEKEKIRQRFRDDMFGGTDD